MRPLLNAGHDPAEYVAIARAVGVDPYELLAQAENEVGGRRRRIDLTLCSHPVDGRSRRTPDIRSRAALRLDLTPRTPSSRGFARSTSGSHRASSDWTSPGIACCSDSNRRPVAAWLPSNRTGGRKRSGGACGRNFQGRGGPSPLTCCQSCGASEREPARHLIPKLRWG